MVSSKNQCGGERKCSDEDSDCCISNSRREINKVNLLERKLELTEEEIKQLRLENRQLLRLINPPPVVIPEPPAYSSNIAS